MKRGWQRVACGATSLLLMVALSGCSDGLEGNRVDMDSVSLEGKSYALYASPQDSGDPSAPFGDGYMILIEDDGSYQTVKTSGQDINSISWSKQGLYFTDVENDYLIHGDEVKTWSNPKPSLMFGPVHITEDGRIITLYNNGFRDGGSDGAYSTLLFENDGNSIKKTDLEGWYDHSVLCGGEVYGISDLTGKYSSLEDASEIDEDYGAEMVAHLSADDGEEVIESTPMMKKPLDGDPICTGDELVYLATGKSGDADGNYGMIVRWSVDDGEQVVTEMSTDQGDPVVVNLKGPAGAQYSRRSLTGDMLEWFGPHGIVYETNMKTGKTSEKYQTDIHYDVSTDAEVEFTENQMIVQGRLGDDENRDPVIITYDRSSGKELDRVRVEGLGDEFGVDMVPRDFAVNPQLRS